MRIAERVACNGAYSYDGVEKSELARSFSEIYRKKRKFFFCVSLKFGLSLRFPGSILSVLLSMRYRNMLTKMFFFLGSPLIMKC